MKPTDYPIKVNVIFLIKSGIKLYRLIKKLIRQLNTKKNMCWKKKEEPVANVNKMLLTFAINNYPGSANDLNGCVNDQNDLIAALPSGWQVSAFKDSEVTRRVFHDTIKNYVTGMRSGDILMIQYSGHGTRVRCTTEEDGYNEALYLYDGIFLDDEFNELMMLIPDGANVIVVLDSCFSGGATREVGRYRKSRYAEYKGEAPIVKKTKSVLNHIVFSGCRSDQTSEDAYINNRYNGAFTFCWLKSKDLQDDYKEWGDKTIYKVHQYGFEQVPTLEGPEKMINNFIFT